jgi:hypothetical protein
VDDFPRGEASFVRVGASQVEVELIEGRLAQELGAAAEGFQVEELVLDEAVDGLHVALKGVGGGRDAVVLGAEVGDGRREVGARAMGLEFADELSAVVGLPSDVAQVDAAALQVRLDALREEFAGLGGTSGSVSEELQAAAHLASGVLNMAGRWWACICGQYRGMSSRSLVSAEIC